MRVRLSLALVLVLSLIAGPRSLAQPASGAAVRLGTISSRTGSPVTGAAGCTRTVAGNSLSSWCGTASRSRFRRQYAA